MSTKKPHIPPNKSVPDNTVVLEYLNNDLSDAAKRQLEEMLTEDELLGDAMEGLKQLKDGHEAAAISSQLNRMIKDKIRKRRRNHRRQKLHVCCQSHFDDRYYANAFCGKKSFCFCW